MDSVPAKIYFIRHVFTGKTSHVIVKWVSCWLDCVSASYFWRGMSFLSNTWASGRTL